MTLLDWKNYGWGGVTETVEWENQDNGVGELTASYEHTKITTVCGVTIYAYSLKTSRKEFPQLVIKKESQWDE